MLFPSVCRDSSKWTENEAAAARRPRGAERQKARKQAACGAQRQRRHSETRQAGGERRGGKNRGTAGRAAETEKGVISERPRRNGENRSFCRPSSLPRRFCRFGAISASGFGGGRERKAAPSAFDRPPLSERGGSPRVSRRGPEPEPAARRKKRKLPAKPLIQRLCGELRRFGGGAGETPWRAKRQDNRRRDACRVLKPAETTRSKTVNHKIEIGLRISLPQSERETVARASGASKIEREHCWVYLP